MAITVAVVMPMALSRCCVSEALSRGGAVESNGVVVAPVAEPVAVSIEGNGAVGSLAADPDVGVAVAAAAVGGAVRVGSRPFARVARCLAQHGF